MDKRDKTERQRQEDVALHKVLYWMLGAAILVFLLRWMQSNYIENSAGVILAWNIGQALPWLCLVGAVLTAAAFFMAFREKKAGKDLLLFWALGGFFLSFTLCVLGIWRFAGIGIQLLTYLVLGLGVLAMIYYLFQRDFVAVGFVSGLGLLGLWLFFREGGTTRLYVAMVLVLLLIAAVVVLARYLQKHGGVLTLKEKKLELLSKGASYAMVYVTCALVALVLIAALVFAAALSHMVFYAVLVAWLLIMAVYYTVKLM